MTDRASSKSNKIQGNNATDITCENKTKNKLK